MKKQQFLNGLLRFLQQSPTPFHAVTHMQEQLAENGFTRLREEDPWELKPGQRYWLTRNDSSLIAFQMPTGTPAADGFRMIGAHTDSPNLRVKPNPDVRKKHYLQLGVEVYGGALLNPWFDRDLSMAGRVHVRTGDGKLLAVLIDFEKAIAVVPSLAIHLDREVNNNRSINAQTHLPPVLTLDKDSGFETMVLRQVHKQHGVEGEKLLGHELSFYDCQAPAVVGLNDEFVAGARLDNLVSCYAGLQAMLAATPETGTMLCCHDHEEVGSMSFSGADSHFLLGLLQRLCADADTYARAMKQSFFISCDNAHGVHPNYADRHDDEHGPLLNGGPVIKINNNQRYASNSRGVAWYRHICEQAQIPYQQFVMRADMACGSTIGPISASNLGVDTLDIGVASFAMHSVRELMGAEDPYRLYQSLLPYLQEKNPVI